MTLMQRRRALMGQKKGGPVFSVYNRSVVAGTNVDTGIATFDTGYAMSCFLDFDVTTNPGSGYGRLYKLLGCQPYKSFTIGKDSGTSVYYSFDWQGTRHDGTDERKTSANPGRKRIAVIHEANSPTITFKYKGDDGDVLTFQYTTAFTASEYPLKIGYGENSDHSLPPGTINSFELYDKIMDSDFIDNFFA